MTDWKVQKTIDYLANLNVGLPDSDWDDFLSRKSAHDLAVKRHRHFLTAAISVPAAAAVLLLLLLLPINRTPAGQTAQNDPEPPQEELQAPTDSISSSDDSAITGGVLAEPTLVENTIAMTSAVTTVRMSNDTVSFNYDTYKQQLDSMLARNNTTIEELDSITADMMERVTAYEQNKGTENPDVRMGSLGMTTGAIGDLSLSESNQKFGGFGGFGGFSGAVQIFAGDTIRGYVTDEDNKPLKDISVDEVDSNGHIVLHSITDSNGLFEFTNVDPNDSILIQSEGYESIKTRMFRIIGYTTTFTLYKVDRVFTIVSEMPEFPGGSSALLNYLKSYVYPRDALKDSIQGRVLVQFIIEKDGSITNVKVENSVYPSLDAEAIRLVLQMPKWKPGKQLGSLRRVRYVVPVNFQLEE